MLLAKRGYTVDVYEREGPALTGTGCQATLIYPCPDSQAIEQTGADPECCSATRAPRLVGMYDMNSGRSLRMPPGHKHIVDRVTLASDLIDEALRLHGGRIKFHFSRQLQGIDLENQVATFCDAGGSTQLQATYDLLIGADGACSTVRDILQAEVTGFRAKTLFEASMCYKTFHGLPVEDYAASETPSAESSGGQATSAVPGEDGRMNGLVAATEDLSVAEQEQLLAEATPKLPVEWRRRIATQTGAEAQQPSSFGQIVRCSRFHGPHIIIIGDAAHCVTSTLGQVHAMVPGLSAKRLPAIMYARTVKTLALVASLLFHKLGLLPSPVYQYAAFFAGMLPVRTIKRNGHLLAAAGAGLLTLFVYGLSRFLHAVVLPASRSALAG
ncbi:g2378 [Coccomyxa elongata]